MGWSFSYGSPNPNMKTEMDRLHNWAEGGTVRRVLRSAMVGSTYYAAVEVSKPDTPTRVFASVCLTKKARNEWGYKGMDEGMGPNEARCPATILNLLSPTEHEYALAWRQRCREHIEWKKARAKVVFKPGMVIEYGGNFYELLRPHVFKKGSWIIKSVDSGREYQISRVKLGQSAIHEAMSKEAA